MSSGDSQEWLWCLQCLELPEQSVSYFCRLDCKAARTYIGKSCAWAFSRELASLIGHLLHTPALDPEAACF